MTIPILEILAFVLIFLRVGGIYFALPIFGDSPTPVRARILLSLATSVCVAPLVSANWWGGLNFSVPRIAILVIFELLIGVVLGFCARIAFDALVMAASIVGYQMGFGTANLLVPDAGMQMDGFTAFHRIIMIMIFFALDLHHIYLYAIGNTFNFIPIGKAKFSADFAIFFTNLTSDVFSTAIQLSSPVLVALLFTMGALGLVARTVPQMNVFTLSFPVSFTIGLMVYIATLPFMPAWLTEYFGDLHENMEMAVIGLR